MAIVLVACDSVVVVGNDGGGVVNCSFMLLIVVLFLVADAFGGEYCIVIGGRCIDGDECVGDVNGYGDRCLWCWWWSSLR
jgi:hypothetical protein